MVVIVWCFFSDGVVFTAGMVIEIRINGSSEVSLKTCPTVAV
jgi:hypothetical protein